MEIYQIVAVMVLSFVLGNLAGHKRSIDKIEQIIREAEEELEGK